MMNNNLLPLKSLAEMKADLLDGHLKTDREPWQRRSIVGDENDYSDAYSRDETDEATEQTEAV
jgi:hypothetical protein